MCGSPPRQAAGDRNEKKEMVKFWLSTDSTCDLYRSYIKENDIWFAPLTFMIEDKDGTITPYLDDFSSYGEYVAFYDKLRAGGYSRTAMLNYEAHYSHFLKMAQAGAREVVHFTISSGLSPTVTVAQKAAADVKKQYPAFTVYAVDSLTATIGQGALVMIARECRDKGMAAKETYDYILGLRLHIQHFIIPSDLYYLKKGGRVSSASAAIGTMLNIKPMITFNNEGKLEVLEKCRGMKKAFSSILAKLDRLPLMQDLPRLYVIHTDNEKEADEIAALLEEKSGIKPHVSIMGPVIGSHVGPGSVSVGWLSENLRNEF